MNGPCDLTLICGPAAVACKTLARPREALPSLTGQKQSLASVCFQLSCSPEAGTREFESWTSIGCSLAQQRCCSARTRSARMPFAEATSMTRDRRQFRSPWSGCFQSSGCCSWVESCGRTTNDLHQLEITASTRFLTSLGRSTARAIINMAIRGPELRPAGAACHWPLPDCRGRPLPGVETKVAEPR